MPSKAPRIPDEIWDRHREEIVSFYLTPHSLGDTMAYMAEKYDFRPSQNQYTRKLESWGIKKYVSSDTWAIVASLKRKRSEEGKDSDFVFYCHKYTRQKVDKEIARHVTLRMEQCNRTQMVTLPDYITVSTPPAESVGTLRKFLFRNLPWHRYTQDIEAFVSRGLQGFITHSTLENSLELTVRELSSQVTNNMLELCIISDSGPKLRSELHAYLPPEDLETGPSSTQNLATQRKNSPSLLLKVFLKRFVYLSTNNLLSEEQFHTVCSRIVGKCGADLLVSLCRLRSPTMKIFARMVLSSVVKSRNIVLARKIIECGTQLEDASSQSRRWTENLSTAFYQGDEAMVELLCKAGAPLEINHEDTWKAESGWESRLSTLQTLLAFGANPESFIKGGFPVFPLIHAARDGCLGAVELLLNAGARVDYYVPHKSGTALQAAVSRGHIEVAKCLIQFGADVNVPSVQHLRNYQWDFLEDGEMTSVQTPVQLAAKMNNLALLQLLLEHRASAEACPFSTHPDLKHSYCHGFDQDLPFSDPSRYKPRYDRLHVVHTALQYGIHNQNWDIAALLLSVGIAPDSRVAPGIGDTPLQMSARLGNFELSQLLLSKGADVHAPPAALNGRTALQGAAESGNWEILSMLYSKGASINAPAGAKLGLTALQAAFLKGHSLMVGWMLAHQANLNTAPSPVMGVTPIQAAAIQGDIELVKSLILLGADVNDPATEMGGTALLAAVGHKSLSLLKILLQHGANINMSGYCHFGSSYFASPLESAACEEWFEGVELLLKNGANVNGTPLGSEDTEIEWLSPLGWAIEHHHRDMVDLLLQHGADVLATAKLDDLGSQSALIHALHCGSSVDILNLLLAEVQVQDLEKHSGWEDALKSAIDDDLHGFGFDFHVFKLILDMLKSMSPSLRQKAIREGWNVLPGFRYAEEKEDEEKLLETIELLMKAGADLDYRDDDGSTLLQRLARWNYHQSCCLLVSHGATVNILASRDWGTPLQEAIQGKNFKIADHLLKNGADVNALPAEGRGVTALQAASMHGMLGMAVRLLELGADVSAPAAPKEGRLAIDAAAEHGHLEMIQLLLNAYGDQEDLAPVCHQAAGYAEKEGHFEISQWLRGYSSA